MEAVATAVPNQQEHVQPLTRLHANGEAHTFTSLEAAQRVCPVLGSMTLEQAQVLFDCEARGQALLQERATAQGSTGAGRPKTTPVIKKIHKVPKPRQLQANTLVTQVEPPLELHEAIQSAYDRTVERGSPDRQPVVEHISTRFGESSMPIERGVIPELVLAQSPVAQPKPMIPAASERLAPIAESSPAVLVFQPSSAAERLHRAPVLSTVPIEAEATLSVSARQATAEAAFVVPPEVQPAVSAQALDVAEQQDAPARITDASHDTVAGPVSAAATYEAPLEPWRKSAFVELLERQMAAGQRLSEPEPDVEYVVYSELPAIEPITLDELITAVPIQTPTIGGSIVPLRPIFVTKEVTESLPPVYDSVDEAGPASEGDLAEPLVAESLEDLSLVPTQEALLPASIDEVRTTVAALQTQIELLEKWAEPERTVHVTAIIAEISAVATEQPPLSCMPETDPPVGGMMTVAAAIEAPEMELFREDTVAVRAEQLDGSVTLSQEVLSESEQQRRLQALCAELCQALGVAVTPEGIASLAIVMTGRDIPMLTAVSIDKLAGPAQSDALPSDVGTHEFLQKLRSYLRQLQRQFTDWYTLGYSAVQLCASRLTVNTVSTTA